MLTHCNAGWLATVDWGTALAPIYRAHDDGIPIHVWVDETRPRNQGAGLTAWELGQHGVAHTVIVDNAGGHVMRQGLVDLCIVGTDRTTAGGDVANKIGTYLKALAAHDNDIPFYVALPSPTIDWEIESGAAIPIERRDSREVTHIEGWTDDGRRIAVRLTPDRQPGRELCLRCDAGAARDRADHRARRLPGLARRAARAVPGTPGLSATSHQRCDGIAGIDHVIVAVRDLERARTGWRRLGFSPVAARTPYRPRHGQLLHHVPRRFSRAARHRRSRRSRRASRRVSGQARRSASGWHLRRPAVPRMRVRRCWSVQLHPSEPRPLGRRMELPEGTVDARASA